MTAFVILMLLLYALIIYDMHQAYMEYQSSKDARKLVLRGVLITGATILAANSMLAILGAEFDLPYIEIHKSVRTNPIFLKTHRPKAFRKRKPIQKGQVPLDE